MPMLASAVSGRLGMGLIRGFFDEAVRACFRRFMTSKSTVWTAALMQPIVMSAPLAAMREHRPVIHVVDVISASTST